MIRDYQAIQRTWFFKGKQHIIPTYGQYKGVKLLGTLNYEMGEILCIEEERYNAVTFKEFLVKVLAWTVTILFNIGHALIFISFLLHHHIYLEIPDSPSDLFRITL